jgi:hypothetical protein
VWSFSVLQQFDTKQKISLGKYIFSYWNAYSLLPRITSLINELYLQASVLAESSVDSIEISTDNEENTKDVTADANDDAENENNSNCPQISSQGCSRVFIVKSALHLLYLISFVYKFF